ncbi:RNA polymerase sigma factor [Spirosoma spitsbergense]|uniref:RNA polymerase sigma factor n=1 Tax=Spirosoma spitsbergense TaxID=431554 RepID=UPI00036B32B9|nr:sigma-70 family RNA polymerase sigma factor [Spirosoma spitsbergense]
MKNQLTPAEHTLLWDTFRRGDREAFSQLYELFAAGLYRYGYNLVRNRQVVEDCLHELFLHIHEKREKLGPTDNIKFYLFRALRRRLLDAIGRLNKLDSDEYLFDNAEFLIESHESKVVEDELIEGQKAVLIDELNKLPKRQKEILYLVYMKGLTYQQAAEVMGITMKSVYNTINTALTTLRAHVQASLQHRNVLLSLLGMVLTQYMNN